MDGVSVVVAVAGGWLPARSRARRRRPRARAPSQVQAASGRGGDRI